MKIYGYIYETTNMINGKKYIGQHKSNTFDPSYHGSGIVLKNAFKKYGIDNFNTIMLEVAFSKDELNQLEKKYILQNNAIHSDKYYNIHIGGTGGNTKEGYSYEQYQDYLTNTSKPKRHSVNVDNSNEKSPMYGKHQSNLSKIKRKITGFRNNKTSEHYLDNLYRDIVLTSSDSEILKSAFSNNNGPHNPRALTYQITNIETGKSLYLGDKSSLAKFFGVSYKVVSKIINEGYYKPYTIKYIGKTQDVSYVAKYSIRRLDNIIRYNNRLKNHNQTVASHSYYVSYTMMRLLEYIDLPIEIKYKLISYCLIHDIAEIHIRRYAS